MQPQVVTLPDVLRSAWATYRAGHLLAQHPAPSKRTPATGSCVMSYGRVWRCAVGSALSPQTLKRYRNTHAQTLGAYMPAVAARGDAVGSVHDVFKVQAAHDFWASAPRRSRARAELNFLGTLRRIATAHGVVLPRASILARTIWQLEAKVNRPARAR